MGAVDGLRDRQRRAVPPIVYVTAHGHSRAVCIPFAEGSGGRLVSAEGGVWHSGQPAVVYGRLRGCEEILRAAQRHGEDWYFIDRGYIRATRDYDYSGYFRVTRNAFQCDGTGPESPERAARLGVELRPWRTTGSHVLVCPPSEVFARLGGINRQAWIGDVVAKLTRSCDREIRVRSKPVPGKPTVSLEHDLTDCWAVVVCNSNIAVEALIRGIPVFTTDRCGTSRLAGGDLSNIETPFTGEGRERWIQCLAAQQWTLAEMRSGQCWTDLQQIAQYEQ